MLCDLKKYLINSICFNLFFFQIIQWYKFNIKNNIYKLIEFFKKQLELYFNKIILILFWIPMIDMLKKWVVKIEKIFNVITNKTVDNYFHHHQKKKLKHS